MQWLPSGGVEGLDVLGEPREPFGRVRAVALLHARTRGEDVLVGLAAGPESVVVDTGDGVGGCGPGEEGDAVPLRERGDLDGGPGTGVCARYPCGARNNGHTSAGSAKVHPVATLSTAPRCVGEKPVQEPL